MRTTCNFFYYGYDWEDKNVDDEISSDELSMVNRGGSWGTVQELRLSDPIEKFENEPIIGIYPVPKKFSFWEGNTNRNATAMDYSLSVSYYQDVVWMTLLQIVQSSLISPPSAIGQFHHIALLMYMLPFSTY